MGRVTFHKTRLFRVPSKLALDAFNMHVTEVSSAIPVSLTVTTYTDTAPLSTADLGCGLHSGAKVALIMVVPYAL